MLSSNALFRLVLRSKPKAIVRQVTRDELKHYFDVEATFQPGLTGMGGDLQFDYERTDDSKSSVEILTCSDTPGAAQFSESATCPRARRSHRCVVSAANEVTSAGDYWSHDAELRVGDTEHHFAVSHVGFVSGATKKFKTVVTIASRDQWTRDISAAADLDFGL